jgi:hypothetical protein
MFQKLKEQWKGKTFATENEMISAVAKVLDQLSENGFSFVFGQ